MRAIISLGEHITANNFRKLPGASRLSSTLDVTQPSSTWILSVVKDGTDFSSPTESWLLYLNPRRESKLGSGSNSSLSSYLSPLISFKESLEDIRGIRVTVARTAVQRD
jgi:hypothetical protein